MPAPLYQFASADPFDDAALRAAPLRLPRPSRLATPLDAPGPRAARALEALGLATVGDLLNHLPRARGEARTVDTLEYDETATILVEVRGISSRPVRRRGMRPIVEALVA
ncbi:MAG TPA: ATP-dependent DNA helicase RecG, partial [Conexibacter sp.]